MPRSIYERGLLKPDDVARLQRVFDEACRRRAVAADGVEAREIALRLLALHNAGLTDEATLIDAAAVLGTDRLSA